jgi:hypothetical protein
VNGCRRLRQIADGWRMDAGRMADGWRTDGGRMADGAWQRLLKGHAEGAQHVVDGRRVAATKGGGV